ncbi:hypothetical protein RIR_jg30282.t1 [Rhizophagus irregularis DAOM 181602=DAOM 197198]|nr:hypothetical protein RhiirB3_1291 [Rhizophagus irregularis]GET52176.1 hypothetical protein RIR_jg30282.t1 [Rhizophagus irregularis DAOM 181602=DAOM 197198]
MFYCFNNSNLFIIILIKFQLRCHMFLEFYLCFCKYPIVKKAALLKNKNYLIELCLLKSLFLILIIKHGDLHKTVLVIK